MNVLKSYEFDSIVGRGLSGALVIPTLAARLGCTFAIVRKPDDRRHSRSEIEGEIGDSWIFVDDLIASGATYRHTRDAVQRAWQTAKITGKEEGEGPVFKGAWLYAHGGEWFPAGSYSLRWPID
jgi:adenine/guanine phosphoribosyltransferase-like PRPP-binding protein